MFRLLLAYHSRFEEGGNYYLFVFFFVGYFKSVELDGCLWNRLPIVEAAGQSLGVMSLTMSFLHKRVGGLKSHSWSSGHTTSGLLDRRESAESSGRLAGVGAKISWFYKAGHWTRLQLKQWRKTAVSYTSSYAEQWTSLRQKRLQLLRYSASACFLLAALVSIVVTFVPSSGSPSPYNATVMPGHRTGRWNLAFWA